MTASVKRPGDRRVVLSRLQADIRGLDADGAAAILRQAQADHWISLHQLADYFAVHPDALTEPTLDAPAALLRLCQALGAAGHDFVFEPRCAGCDRPNVRLVSPGPNGRICGTCRSRDYLGTCPRCGRQARLVARRAEGVICGSCYDRDPDRMEPCGGCDASCIPESRAVDGTARCRRCHPRRSHVCTECGTPAPAAVVNAGRPVCYRCYDRPKRRCGRCGRVRIVKRGATIDGPDLCDSCYRGPDAVCTVCGRTRPCHGAKSGRPLCASCRPRPRRRCDRCARVRPISAHWPIGAVCSICYDQVRANPGPCTGCGKISPLIAGEPDQPTCGPCAGFDVNYECAGCGNATLLFRDGYCHRCVLTGRLAHLLAGPEQTVSPQLAPLAAALAAVDKPHTVLIWLGYSPTARLLVDLAATGQPITHARLDTLKPSKAVHYIRDVLVTAGVLPDRDELLERVPPFVDDLLAGQPEIARIVKPYAQWFLLRRTRQRRRTPLTSKGAAQKLRDQVRAAASLLAWLADQSLSLAELNQDLLDRWLTEHPTRHDAVVNFVTWTSRHHLTPQLRVARRPGSAPHTFLTDSEHTDQLRRCLHDDDIPIEYRAAGTLALLFGLPMSRITQLRTDQIIRTDTATLLAVGRHHLRLPPRVACLVHELLSLRPRWQVLERHNTPSPWLFPGQSPTRPASASKMHGGLHRHGITVLAGRNTARTALAAELPATVLADLTGININTGVAWSRQVKHDWAGYVALRAQDAPASTGRSRP